MTTYLPTLEKVEIGLEATFGAVTAPSVALVGVTDCKITPKIDSAQVLDKRGTTMPAYIATVNRISGEADISGLLDYHQIVYWLDAMFGVDAPPSVYLAELDGVPVSPIQHILLVHGQDGLTYALQGGTLDKLTIKGDTNGPLTYAAHLNGKTVVSDTFLPATIPAPEIAKGCHCALYIDPLTGPVGTTAITATAFSFEWAPTVDRSLVWHLGSLMPDSIREGKWGGSMKLSLQMTAAQQAVLDAALGDTVTPEAKTIQIKATGVAPHILALNFAGQLLGVPTMFNDNAGLTSAEMEFAPVYSPDATFLSCWGATLALA